jgi:hypothetical protein
MAEKHLLLWRPQHERSKRNKKLAKFFQFINYNWGFDDMPEPSKEPNSFDAKLGSRSWQVYKDVNKYAD